MTFKPFLLALALAAAPQQQASPPPPLSGQPPAHVEYILGPQDHLQITVQGVAELTREVTLDQDGSFDFPYIGRISAGGKGVRAVEADLKTRLSPKYLVNPSINVEVKSYRMQNVYVFGQVARAGMVKIQANANLMSVLAEAGFNNRAGSTITITRWPKGTKPTGGSATNAPNAEVITVSRRDLEQGRAQSILLQEGDTIIVPESEKFSIQGEVRNVGLFELDTEMTLQQALAIAGGVTDRGAKNRIEIQRVGIAKPFKNVKMTEIIKAGDIITVPKRRL